MPRPFLTAEWRFLVMANFAVDPDILEPFVPAGTELDRHAGTAYVSVVGFQFLATKVYGVAIPWHRHFQEINLRCYVRREHPGGTRRGVVFLREVVRRRAIAAVARWAYNEPYEARPTFGSIAATAGGERRVGYGYRGASGWAWLEASVAGEPAIPPPGSVQEFISEHYWGYNHQRDGSTLEYRVEHPPWRVWTAQASRVAGAFAPFLRLPPTSVFVADGSPVRVLRGARLSS